MMLSHWIHGDLFLFLPILSLVGLDPVWALGVSGISKVDFVKGDTTISSLFAIHSTGSLPAYANTVDCASLCNQEPLCVGFYFDDASSVKTCHLGTGGLISEPDPSFNRAGVLLYRHKSLTVCPTSDGFKLKVINGQVYCFLFVEKPMKSYEAARERCNNKGANLFHFDDDVAKLNALQQIINMWPNDVSKFWIGLHSPGSRSNSWYWEYNDRLLTNAEKNAIPWVGSPPKSKVCGAAEMGSKIKVDDEPCDKDNEYLCEFEM